MALAVGGPGRRFRRQRLVDAGRAHWRAGWSASSAGAKVGLKTSSDGIEAGRNSLPAG